MTKTVQIEVWVVIDEAGDYSVGKDQEEASEQFEEHIGGPQARRQVKVTLTVPLPRAIELTGTVPEESDEGCDLTVQ